MPILNESRGGTSSKDANIDDARKIVPSPPKVIVRSTFSWKSWGDQASIVPEYVGKGKSAWTSLAARSSRRAFVKG